MLAYCPNPLNGHSTSIVCATQKPVTSFGVLKVTANPGFYQGATEYDSLARVFARKNPGFLPPQALSVRFLCWPVSLVPGLKFLW